MQKLKYILLIFTIAANFALAQDYNFKQFTQKQGLENVNVKCIFQDSYGYIWFATQGGGVSRFDGTKFKTYTKQDGLVGNDVLSITEDDSSNIWISTLDGVSKFNRKTFQNYTTENGLKSNKAYHILCDKNKVWISTFGGGICILENGKFSYLNNSNGLSSDKIFCVYKDQSGKYWIGTSKGGINIYNGKSITVIKESKGFNSQSAFCFLEAKDGKFWIGTPGKGIFYIENNVIQQLNVPDISTDYIYKITEDKNHNIWCATDFHGLLKINTNHQIHFFNQSNGLKGVDIPYVFADYENNLWISCFSNGVYKLNNEAISVFTKTHGLLDNKILSLTVKGKNLYINTNNGLLCFNDSTIQAVNIPKEIKTDNLYIIKSIDKKLFIGSYNGSIYELNEIENNNYLLHRKIAQIDSFTLKNVSGIDYDHKTKTLWVGFYGTGIAKITDNKTVLYCKENHLLPNNDVMSIKLVNNELLVGTIGNGLYSLNTTSNELKSLNKLKNITSNSIYSLNHTKNATLVGSLDEGLFILTKDGTINISKKDGLTSNVINAIEISNDSTIWLGTDLGITKLIIDQDFKIKSHTNYTDEDGLKNPAIEQNAIITFNGNLYFGTGDGLVRYNQKEDIISQTKPRVVINEIVIKYSSIDSEKIKHDGENKLGLIANPIFNYKQNDITFHFKALSSNANQYQYYLEGYDKDWSPKQNNTEAVFTNLPHGKYILKLKAINKYGIESDILEYPFEITPPFYLTWWFFILSIITIIASIILFIKYRTQKLIKEKQVLETKVNERTIELKSANSNLNVALGEIKDSINYAQRIQSSILPETQTITEHLPNSFILYKPRDIVSGDFYWFNQVNNKLIFATVDCTGHGVPGAFMSMIGNSLLNEIILTKKITGASDILSNLNRSIFKVLKQNTSESKDGMDMALVVIDKNDNTLTYAGANRELLLIRNGELIEYKPTKNAIGGFTDSTTIFAETKITFTKEDKFYMTTDGYADQFGGPKGKKLMTKNFKEFLLKISSLNMKEQKQELDQHIINWMANTYSQVDDILVVGIKVD